MRALTVAEAEEELEGVPLVSALAGSLADLKIVRDRCLASGIPVILGCPGGGTCGPRTHLLLEQDDVPRVAALLSADWQELMAREGLAAAQVGVETTGDEEPPCPACGHAGPLAEGACADCGLVVG